MMFRKTRNVLLLLATLAVTSAAAAAQTPVHSFAELQPVVRPGQQVIVWGDDGRKVSGRVVSATGNQLEIRRRRWNFRSEQRLFTESAVRRVDTRDSDWNGHVLGFGAGAAAAWVACKATSGDPDNWSCLPWVALAPMTGAGIGAAIDRAINRPLYLTPGKRVGLHPQVGRERAGLVASVSF